ncbi:glycine betaine ABC transporter substrate-binding protein [Streptomyces brasiliscabiei]|uniref:Glycine betaine ABC transporter substrate-binding protein n=1 Tax=Streptomyces brasiliscabiei TaxID=2736302 RepID=A0ABU8GLC7_9ACTN
MAAYLNENPSSKVCVESEFLSRVDGYPGDAKAYGITGGRTTSPGIGALGLRVLEDDKSFFPICNAVPQVMRKTDEEHPEILEVLEPLAEILTTEVMQEPNTAVRAKGEEPATTVPTTAPYCSAPRRTSDLSHAVRHFACRC